jgi:hypothetical protein
MDPREELAFLRFVTGLEARLADVADVERALRVASRLLKEHFRADAAALVLREREPGRERVFCSLPGDERWDLDVLQSHLSGPRRSIPNELLFARIERHGRAFGMVVLRRAVPFPKSEIRALSTCTRKLSAALGRIDHERITEVRARLDQKMLAQLRPQDLFYQLLHGLRTLTHYDHGAAVLVHEGDPGALVLVAEQVAWRKGGSARIGRTLAISAPAAALLETGEVFGFDRDARGELAGWGGQEAEPIAELLERLATTHEPDGKGRPVPAEGSLLCAPLATRDGLLGVLAISALHREPRRPRAELAPLPAAGRRAAQPAPRGVARAPGRQAEEARHGGSRARRGAR